MEFITKTKEKNSPPASHHINPLLSPKVETARSNSAHKSPMMQASSTPSAVPSYFSPGGADPAFMSPMSSTVANSRHKKTSSLVGFDPLLAAMASPSSSPVSALPFADNPISPMVAESKMLSQNGAAFLEDRGSPKSPRRQKDLEKRTSNSPKRDTKKKAERSVSPQTPAQASKEEQDCDEGKQKKGLTQKILSKVKKGHRKTRSLEMLSFRDSTHKKMSSQTDQICYTPGGDGGKRLNPDNGIVNDLMDLKFDTLQIPSLAKPSPTSFLTGTDNEVLRTCEYEAAPFQMEIPSAKEMAVPARLTEFVENYKSIDQNFDLGEWIGLNKMDLKKITFKQHVPIAQLLMDCGEDICIKGVITKGTNIDDQIEAVVFEGQQNFIVVVRGPSDQQLKPCIKKSTNRESILMRDNEDKTDVYQYILEEYRKIELECFDLLDKLKEEEPFCDILFTGYSFGGALSTLAAVRYANARPMTRAKCYPMASPKVGFDGFRRMVNSTPNLRVIRMEYGQDAKCQLPGQGSSHVGHTLVLNPSLGNKANKTKNPIRVHKFESPKLRTFKTINPDLRSYVSALDEIIRMDLPCAKDFVGITGQGVVVGDEERLVV